MTKEEKLLQEIVSAWEELPEGFYSSDKIEEWLVEDMKPVIDKIRNFLKTVKL